MRSRKNKNQKSQNSRISAQASQHSEGTTKGSTISKAVFISTLTALSNFHHTSLKLSYYYNMNVPWNLGYVLKNYQLLAKNCKT